MLSFFRATLIVSVFSVFQTGLTFAEENLRDILTGKYSGEKDVCSTVKQAIKRGVDAQEVTKTGIAMGNRACYVIKCAIDGGGELKKVVAGAVDAGTTSDVISRCAIDAVVDPEQVAQILESLGLLGPGYWPPEADRMPVEAGWASRMGAGRHISPSSF